MARTKGMLNLSGNLEVNAGAPLDARSVVPTVADLTVAANFQYKYIGMTVTVQATGDMYTLLTNDVTDIANWKKVGSGGGGTSYTAGDGIVIDNDEISTDNMPAADMAEIVNPLPSVMSRYHTYSEDEQIVAYWEETVNGVKVRKPVYEKVVYNISVAKGTDTTVATITNIDKLILFRACRYLFKGSKGLGIAPDDASSLYFVGDDAIFAQNTSGTGVYDMIFQYTKTTDQWIPV